VEELAAIIRSGNSQTLKRERKRPHPDSKLLQDVGLKTVEHFS